ncbi:YqzL family protein [Halalkalibacterium halodurans]|uniref:YqzL family protein n=1 Tax=Halalkalibacterium halodurans TaxID=86665 RepID=UPI002AA99B05|nr:YqzL family protein [Halalkalibacterium halodurans]MDY7221893.1 YqzL family protein [Halalkalibacterium halodurans]MDY7241169.1 YqzL family protein [Halalkalibacterium halodurans]
MLRTFKSFYRKVESEVLDLSWKVFEKTGNVDTYLLIKEIERASDQQSQMEDLELVIEEQDSPTH